MSNITLPQPMAERLERLVSDPTLGETTPGAAVARADAGQLLELQRLVESPAYFNSRDPLHLATKAKVSALIALEFPGGHGRKPSALVLDSGDPNLPLSRQR